jgi:metallophosphoesterase (TIGR00282 family)
MIILYFADIFAKPGRRAVAAALPQLKAEFSPDFIIGNAENLAGGRGTNRRCFQEMIEQGFHGFTSGNHVWDNKDVYAILSGDTRLIRPANYPNPTGDPTPGKGYGIIKSGSKELFVINLLGRVFMEALECPFATVDKILAENPVTCPILVDMHADATSEKYAMGWHLAGRVAAVVGSHSHVQTADERILPGGTAYITDVGMSGAFDSVIGLKKEEIIRRFITKRPQHYQSAKENPGVGCVVIKVGTDRKATSIERFRFSVDITGREYSDEKDME